MSHLPGYMNYFDPIDVPGVPPNLQWLPMAILAALTIIIIHGLMLGISRAFNMQELERYAKAEILNSLATALMVIFLITMVTSAETFSIQYFLGEGVVFRCGGEDIAITQLSNSIDLLKCRLIEKAEGFASIHNEIMKSALSVFDLLNIYLSFVGIPIFQGGMVGEWFKQAETLRLMNTLVTTLLIGLNGVIATTDYVKNNMLSFYLPLGLILRAFPYTRGIGAFFMSLAIGLYFIYPLLYIITDPGFVKPSYTAPPSSTQTVACYPSFTGVVYSIQSSTQSAISSGGAALSLSQLKSDIGSVYSSVLLQPFIVFAVTMLFVRYMMYILGGEAQDLMRAVMRVV